MLATDSQIKLKKTPTLGQTVHKNAISRKGAEAQSLL